MMIIYNNDDTNDTESFRYFLFQAWGVVAVAREARPEKR